MALLARFGMIVLIIASVSACTIQPTNRDSAPHNIPLDLDTVKEPVPRDEPFSKYGNPKSYQVNGKTYFTLKSNSGFKESGHASWYGTKFHGRRTSSGEPYDMFAMTAAHKRLPIPSYVRVKNLENDKSIIVRVNDRGPFHGDRIIDLSYAAAHKLGYADKGTAKVQIEAISFEAEPSEPLEQNLPQESLYLQAGAFGDRQNAQLLQQKLREHALMTVIEADSNPSGVIHRVFIGPLGGNEQAQSIQALLNSIGVDNTKLIKAGRNR